MVLRLILYRNQADHLLLLIFNLLFKYCAYLNYNKSVSINFIQNQKALRQVKSKARNNPNQQQASKHRRKLISKHSKTEREMADISEIASHQKIEEREGMRAKNRELFTERISFLTRSLVKNNIIKQNFYLILLTLEYLSMMYYIVRLADAKSFNRAFSIIENFLDISMNENGVQVESVGGETETTQTTSYMENKALIHIVANLLLLSIFTVFTLMFFNKLYEVKNFDQTQEQSYMMKTISVFMVMTQTVLQMPVFISIFVLIKQITLGLQSKLYILMIFSNTVLILQFVFVLIYSLKFFNLEVPNDEIPWSHNQTSGIYLKVVLKIALCTQELYRGSLNERLVLIIVLGFILGLEGLILIYRMNTPNIFNTMVHAVTLFLESLMTALTIIGIIALITEKDILSTLAYLFIFIPVMVKIFFAIDERRKHQVLFKLKNEETLSDNEYLIALTHLLKMVKRQSETDIAQLLSFTYYHKLYCYDTSCICQFFTQYCQDPLKFKNKKKRSYQGYIDDGFRLLQESKFTEKQEAALQLNQPQNQTQNPKQLQQFVRNPSSGNALEQQSQLGSGKIIRPVEAKGPNGTQPQASVGEIGGQLQNYLEGELNPTQEANIFPQGTKSTGLPSTIQPSALTTNNMEASMIDVQDLTQNEFLKREGTYGKDDDENQDSRGGLYVEQNQEYRETGIMTQFAKGSILQGSAYNGYDANMDFKVKNEFKSPSQFKSIQEGRTYFFTRLLEMMFRQLESRTNKNTSFNLIYIFFHFTYQHNVYLSINTLVKLSRSLRRSLFSKMTFAVSEYYLLEMILSEFKRNTKDEIDYTSFIKSNQMSQKLDWLFEDAAQDIIQFWQIFKDENANVEKAYILGMQISANVKQIREYTRSLEEKELIKDYNKYYYYAMFYQNLLNDKQAYQQMVANLKNLIMVRNMRKKNTRFGTNMNDINDVGFAILSYDDDKFVGRFIYCNKIACQIFGVSEEKVIGESVIAIMPESVKLHHELFVKRFQQEGMPRIFGRVRNLFIKDFNENIVPVQFYINFHYSSQFSYSLILHVDPIQFITYFGTQIQIPIKYCIFFLCDNFNVILDYTSNAKKLLGFSHKVKKEQEEIIGRSLKMDDIVHQMARLETQIEQNNLKFLPNVPMKVRNFKQTAEEAYTQCSMTFQEIMYLSNYAGEFCERIYLLIPGKNVPDLESSSTTSGINSAAKNAAGGSQAVESLDQYAQNSSDQTGLKDSDNGVGGLSASVSSISSTSSRNSSASMMNNTKNLLFSNRSPRILKLYLYIVFGVFFSFMIVTTINFVIYMDKKATVDLKIQFNQMVNKRSTYMASSILCLKQMHMITLSGQNSTNSSSSQTKDGTNTTSGANYNYTYTHQAQINSKQNISQIFPENRYTLYNNEMIKGYDGLQEYHFFFKRMDQRYSTELGTDTEQNIFKSVNVSLVGDRGKIYGQNQTLDGGISLMITNLGMIDSAELQDELLPLDLYMKILQNQGEKVVSKLFRSLYFIYENGMTSLNSLGQIQEQQIQANTIKTSDQSKLFVNLISFISIGVITIIGVFTFPLLGKIEDRKISVLKFFNLLGVEQITDMIDKGKEFQVEFESMTRSNDGLIMDGLAQEEDEEDNAQEGGMGEDFNMMNASMVEVEVEGKSQGKKKSLPVKKKHHKKSGAKEKDKVKTKGKATEDVVEAVDSSGDEKGKNPIQGSSVLDKESDKTKKSKTLGRGNSADDINNIMRKIRKNDQERTKKDYLKKKGPNASVAKHQVDDMAAVFNSTAAAGSGPRKANNLAEKIEEEIKDEKGGKKKKGANKGGKGKHLEDKKERQGTWKSKMSRSAAGQSSGSDHDMDANESDDEEDGSKDTPNSGKKGSQKKKKDKMGGTPVQEDPSSDVDDDYESERKHGPNDSSKQGQYQMRGIASATNRSDLINVKVEKIALREKLKLACYVLAVLLFLNSCLIICFYLGQKTFQDDSKTLFNLATFYHRENCLDNLMLYTLEQFVQNKTIDVGLSINSEFFFTNSEMNLLRDAPEYYLSRCQKTEQDYNELRRNLPAFMIDVADQIDQLESSNLCAVTYKSIDKADKRKLCEQTYDQIMKRGLTSVVYMIFNYAQQLTVKFQKEGEIGRTEKFNLDVLYDQKVKDIIDIITYYIHDSLYFMDDLITSNALGYFNQLANYYLIIFVSYMVVSVFMSFIFGLVIFKKLKQQIMTSANIIAIMPLDDMDHKDRHKIDQFLNS